jgi:DNA invertase Pin-like site-specific DNA recombinase
MMQVAIYARVSTTSQTVENQLIELRDAAKRLGWTVSHEIVDEGISGSKGRSDRPGFDRIFELVEQKAVGAVMAWSVDRIGRSLQDLVALMKELQRNSVELYCHQQNINTATPAGRMTFSIFGALGEYERSLIIERIYSGIARAKAAGVRFGRPRIHDDAVRVRILELRRQGKTLVEVARELGVGFGTVWRVCRQQEKRIA